MPTDSDTHTDTPPDIFIYRLMLTEPKRRRKWIKKKIKWITFLSLCRIDKKMEPSFVPMCIWMDKWFYSKMSEKLSVCIFFLNSIFIKTLIYNSLKKMKEEQNLYVHNLCAVKSACKTTPFHMSNMKSFHFSCKAIDTFNVQMTDKENRSFYFFFSLWNWKRWNLNNIDSHYRNMKAEKKINGVFGKPK